jgi:hypothetical protein
MARAHQFFLSFFILAITACLGSTTAPKISGDTLPVITPKKITGFNNDSVKTIHVFVALCDNKYQGIVPVPASIGNGQDPKTNLYWGSGYGIKSFFLTKSNEWKFISSELKPAGNILERLLFKHKLKNIYLLADAYDGQFIQQTTIDFLNAASGKNKTTIKNGNKEIYFGVLLTLSPILVMMD